MEARDEQHVGLPVTSERELLAVYDRWVSEVHRYAMRLTGGDRSRSEDLTQETFLRLLRDARSGGRVVVDVSWLIVTLRNRFIDELRSADRAERRLRLVQGGERFDGSPVAGPASASELLGELPDRQRAALVLRYVDDLSVAQTADALALSVHATESLLARGRAELRRRLEKGVSNAG